MEARVSKADDKTRTDGQRRMAWEKFQALTAWRQEQGCPAEKRRATQKVAENRAIHESPVPSWLSSPESYFGDEWLREEIRKNLSDDGGWPETAEVFFIAKAVGMFLRLLKPVLKGLSKEEFLMRLCKEYARVLFAAHSWATELPRETKEFFKDFLVVSWSQVLQESNEDGLLETPAGLSFFLLYKREGLANLQEALGPILEELDRAEYGSRGAQTVKEDKILRDSLRTRISQLPTPEKEEDREMLWRIATSDPIYETWWGQWWDRPERDTLPEDGGPVY
jgi:hypothetical protein